MSGSNAGAFWSYAHQDDKADGGRIVALADDLRAEFALQTGAELDLFVDRDGLEWGEDWRKRIDGAIAETRFFIPIVSPTYFTRAECRRELLSFAAAAEQLGAADLLLPILYVHVPELSRDNADNAVALIARMQYVDWQQLRLAERSSADYRRAVSHLAKRLASVATDVARRRLQPDPSSVRDDGDTLPVAPEVWALLDRINPLIRRELESTGSARAVANDDDFAALVRGNQGYESSLYSIEILPNSIVGFGAGRGFGIYTVHDNGGSKVNFDIHGRRGRRIGLVNYPGAVADASDATFHDTLDVGADNRGRLDVSRARFGARGAHRENVDGG